jgi:hypothetical protein
MATKTTMSCALLPDVLLALATMPRAAASPIQTGAMTRLAIRVQLRVPMTVEQRSELGQLQAQALVVHHLPTKEIC